MRALVLGDLGFLGRHFAAELRSQGWEVTGIDSKRSASQDCRSWLWTVPGLRPGQFDLVVHAAAVVGGREVIDGDPLATAVNFELDASVFRWAAVTKPGRLLYFSSSAVYPVLYQREGIGTRLRESDMALPHHLMQPDQIYGWSKAVGEVLAPELRAAGVPVTVVRPFSGYGADQDLTYPFPAFIARAKARQDPFELWCGDCVRDFIHVDDVVGASLMMCDEGEDGPLNLCTGRGTSFTELAQLVCEAAGYAPELAPQPGKPSGVHHRVGDPSLINGIWAAKVRLEEGIRRALES